MNVRIESDGSVSGTKVSLMNGEPLKGVTAADIQLRVNDHARAYLEMIINDVDVVAEAEFETVMMPDGKVYRLVPNE